MILTTILREKLSVENYIFQSFSVTRPFIHYSFWNRPYWIYYSSEVFIEINSRTEENYNKKFFGIYIGSKTLL